MCELPRRRNGRAVGRVQIGLNLDPVSDPPVAWHMAAGAAATRRACAKTGKQYGIGEARSNANAPATGATSAFGMPALACHAVTKMMAANRLLAGGEERRWVEVVRRARAVHRKSEKGRQRVARRGSESAEGVRRDACSHKQRQRRYTVSLRQATGAVAPCCAAKGKKIQRGILPGRLGSVSGGVVRGQ